MLEQIIDPNERILWQGRPNKLMYVIGSPGMYVFALIWGAFDFFFISLFLRGFGDVDPFAEAGSHLGGWFFGGPEKILLFFFFLLHLAPVWAAIITPIYRFFSWHNVEYALTDKRLYLVSGLFGRDIVNVELRDVQNLSVNVNPIENLLHLGTIQLTPDTGDTYRANRRRMNYGYRLKHIEQPYEIYHQIKRVSLDVYTDQMYPNQYRPEVNPGYQTEYDDRSML